MRQSSIPQDWNRNLSQLHLCQDYATVTCKEDLLQPNLFAHNTKLRNYFLEQYLEHLPNSS